MSEIAMTRREMRTTIGTHSCGSSSAAAVAGWVECSLVICGVRRRRFWTRLCPWFPPRGVIRRTWRGKPRKRSVKWRALWIFQFSL